MKKIPSLFIRDWTGDRSLVTCVVDPACLWVADGEGRATRKYDGTACMLRKGQLFKRYDWKDPRKTPPAGFEACQERDEKTGHMPGWVPIGEGADDAWAREALAELDVSFGRVDGTYELCGPRIGANAEDLDGHYLIPHGNTIVDAPRDYEGLASWLAGNVMEGIVWHHPDGRMAKIKRTDFGLRWPTDGRRDRRKP